MPSLRQIQASRANGALSHGPTTPEGKRNSSRNSIRHGLLAETVVLEGEKTAPFLELLEELVEEHHPRTPTEVMLVETIAIAYWRQNRIWGMQKVAFDEDVASSTSTTDSNPLCAVKAWRSSPDSVRVHELMLRYEVALDRQISRALLRLQQMQARELPESAKGAAPTVAEEPIAPPSVLRESSKESTSAKQTQQPVETITPPPPAPVQIRPLQSSRPKPPRSAGRKPAVGRAVVPASRPSGRLK